MGGICSRARLSNDYMGWGHGMHITIFMLLRSASIFLITTAHNWYLKQSSKPSIQSKDSITVQATEPNQYHKMGSKAVYDSLSRPNRAEPGSVGPVQSDSRRNKHLVYQSSSPTKQHRQRKSFDSMTSTTSRRSSFAPASAVALRTV